MNTKAAIERTREWFGSTWQRSAAFVRRRPVVSAAMLPAAALLYVLALIPFTPSIGDIKKAKQEQPTVVLSADGKELAVFKRANRDWVKLSDISPKTVEALLATEDHRFYEHPGLDVKRTAKAVLNTLRGDREGGSTITQQLARNLYPEEIGRAPTVTRKLKEAITALKIEAVYSKDEILETYLNSVSFLYNAWGIEMAARTYFDKPAKALDEVESATLVGMLKGTSYYNPVLNPERALDRRNIVLAQLVRHQKLSPEKYERLKTQPLKLDFERQPEFAGMAPHMAEHLRRWLHEWADRNDYNIYADGLVVRTTIDSRLQEAANEAVAKQGKMLQAVADVEWARSGLTRYGTDPSAYLAQQSKVKAFDYFWSSRKDVVDAFVRESGEYRALREQGTSEEEALQKLRGDSEFMAALRRSKTRLQAGFLALEPNTGQIRAWVGSRDYNEDKFDHVQQARRQPGSTFKPFVYGAAFEQGIHPNETLVDAPVAIQIDRNQVWRPGDVGEGPTNLPMTLREGLARSKNTITAQLMMRVGPSRVASLARAMGVRESKLAEVPSLALGTSPVTLKEMVSSFGSIANGGSYVEPILVTAVQDRDGTVLASFHTPAPETAMSNQAAMTLLDVMRDVVIEGTAVGLKHRFGIDGDVAGKTGTTQDNTDGWFILMHPQLVAGAWVGFNDNRVAMRSEYWGQGSHNALLVVGDFMRHAIKGKVVDAKAQFAAPRMADTGQPLFNRMNDWFNSVFHTPAPLPGDSEVVVVSPPPPLEPPVLEPPPESLSPPPQGLPMNAPWPDAAQTPAYGGSQRVPSFPRPLEPARPTESVPGTQVYRAPPVIELGSAGAAPSASAGSSATGSASAPATTPEEFARRSSSSARAAESVLVPRPWRAPESSRPGARGTADASVTVKAPESAASSPAAAAAATASTAGTRASQTANGSASSSTTMSPSPSDASGPRDAVPDAATGSPTASGSPAAAAGVTGTLGAGGRLGGGSTSEPAVGAATGSVGEATGSPNAPAE